MRLNTTMTAGMGMRGIIRRKLDRVQLHGLLDSWKEQKGWFDSEFFIYGIDDGVWESIKEWIAEVNREDND